MMKNEMNATSLQKKKYVKPTLKVVYINKTFHLLEGSLRSVRATGLDDTEELELITNPSSIWDLAK